MAFNRRLVPSGDVTLETFVGGSGAPTVAATHAFIPATASGGLVAGPLANITETVSVNLRSMGGSDPGDGPTLSFERAAHDLEALRVSLGYDRWVFAGGSAGGFIGLYYALLYPASLLELILVGTAASYRGTLDPDSVYHPDHPDHAALVSAPLEPDPGEPTWTERVWPLLSRFDEPVRAEARRAAQINLVRFGALAKELPTYDLEPRLGEVEVPTLVVHGRHDSSMPVGQGEIIASAIGDAELILLDCGHFPFWECPAEFEAAVRIFLERIGG